MYDMDGLAMYDDGMGAYITQEQLKEVGMSGLAGAGGILLTSAIVQRIPWPATWSPAATSYAKAASSVVLGVVGARMLWDKNRDAAMGLAGAVIGGTVAQLVASMAVGADGTQYLSTGLAAPQVTDTDLAALEAAVSSQSPAYSAGAFAGLNGPQVTSRALSAPGVTSEQLSEYMPYLS